jgi:hypothetical protein
MGIISITGIVLVQESVEWSMRGSATSSIIFSRSLGNTLGATALGAILIVGIKHYGSGELAGRLDALLNEPNGLGELAGNTDMLTLRIHDKFIRGSALDFVLLNVPQSLGCRRFSDV